MSTDLLHPDLQAVLKDIAQDPQAKLLRIRKGFVPTDFSEDFRAGPAAPGLTVAERHLLATYREELGELLRQRCLIEFFDQPGADRRWHKSVTATRTLEVPDKQQWSEGTEATLAQPLEASEANRLAQDLLAQCLDPQSKRPSITQLAMASLRVAPRDKARIYCALDLLAQGCTDLAKSALHEAVSRAPSSLVRAYAHESLGAAYGLDGDFKRAAQHYVQSLNCEIRPVPAIGLLLAGILDRNLKALAQAEEHLCLGLDHAEGLVEWSRAWILTMACCHS